MPACYFRGWALSDQSKVENSERPLEDKPFTAMSTGEKARFIVKALVFFVTGGFIYPTLWID
jgi:hypothetical protein